MSAVLWLPLRSSYFADNGVELNPDWNMEAVGVGWYTPGVSGAILTKEPGTISGTGTQVLRITGGTGFAYPSPTISVVNRRYHYRMWARGDGAVGYPALRHASGAAMVPFGTTSTAAQFFEAATVAGSASSPLYSNMGAGGYVEVDDCSIIEQFMYTANMGSLKSALQCGDGRTSTTWPTKLPYGAGYALDGGDYWVAPAGVGNLVQVTLVVAGRFSKGAGFPGLLGHVLAGTVGFGLDMTAATGRVTFYSAGATQFVTGSKDIADGQPHTVAGVYDGTTAYVYVDGVLDNSAARTGSTGDGGAFYVGRGAVTNTPITASYYGAGLYPYASTPTQLRSLHERMLLEVNTP